MPTAQELLDLSNGLDGREMVWQALVDQEAIDDVSSDTTPSSDNTDNTTDNTTACANNTAVFLTFLSALAAALVL